MAERPQRLRPSKGPSYLDKIASLKDEDIMREEKFVRTLLVGEPGSGKTTLGASFPNPLFINTDKGLKTLEHIDKTLLRKQIPFSRGEAIFDPMRAILSDVKNRTGLFSPDGPTKDNPTQGIFADRETLVFDGYTKFGEFLMHEIMTKKLSPPKDPYKDKPGFDGYGLLGNFLTGITELLTDLPINIVATCWVKSDTDEDDNFVQFSPNVMGSFRYTIAGMFDEVYLLEQKSKLGKTEYVLSSRGTRKVPWLKSRADIPATITNPTYEKLYGKQS
jgi:hypothetical protein